MFSPDDIYKAIKQLYGDHVPYTPYNFKDTLILYGGLGTPPLKVQGGVDYIDAQHYLPQKTLVMSLNGSGVHVTCNNMSGFIEFGIMQGTAICGALQLMIAIGLPQPITVIDGKSGGTSFALGTACQRVGTPAWSRRRYPQLEIFTFSTPRLFLSSGIRLAA